MRSLLRFSSILFTVAAVMVGSAQAQVDGPARTGGGLGVPQPDGSLILSDLVKGDCQWSKGVEFASQLGYFEKFKHLKNLNSTLAMALIGHLSSISVCIQDQPINPEVLGKVEGAITIYKNTTDDVLIAVRMNDRIYVDKNALKLLPESNRPVLVLHEIMHSLIERGQDRLIRLRSFVKYLSDSTEDTDPADVYRQMGFAKVADQNRCDGYDGYTIGEHVEADVKAVETATLCVAANAGSLGAISSLLSQGVDPTLVCSDNTTVFQNAVSGLALKDLSALLQNAKFKTALKADSSSLSIVDKAIAKPSSGNLAVMDQALSAGAYFRRELNKEERETAKRCAKGEAYNKNTCILLNHTQNTLANSVYNNLSNGFTVEATEKAKTVYQEIIDKKFATPSDIEDACDYARLFKNQELVKLFAKNGGC